MRAKPASQKEWLDELEQLLSETRFAGQSGIIYTTTVKDCDELAAELARRRLRVAAYHANLEPARRSSVHQKWLTNDLQARNCHRSQFLFPSRAAFHMAVPA